VIESPPEAGFRTLGQPTARRIVQLAVEREQLGRTLLVHGPSGAGKEGFVDDLLALFFCTHPDRSVRPCNACRGCHDGRARSHPDLVLGSPEAWRERKSQGESIVAAARRWLLDAAGAPVVAERRIVLIEHADRASEQIQNALLKSLEEPSDRHTFVLVADEPAALLPTIRSRCQPLRIGPVPSAELVAHLMDVRRLPRDLAESLARISDGLSGIAEAYVEDGSRLDWRRRTQLQLVELLERGRADRFGSVRDLLDETARGMSAPADAGDEDARTPAAIQRVAATAIADVWLSLARDLLVAGAGRPDLAPGAELSDQLQRIAERIGPSALLAFVATLERVHEGLAANAAPRLSLEAAMLAWPMLPRTAR
jgi:DNA polymerase-3 subunit delta'